MAENESIQKWIGRNGRRGADHLRRRDPTAPFLLKSSPSWWATWPIWTASSLKARPDPVLGSRPQIHRIDLTISMKC